MANSTFTTPTETNTTHCWVIYQGQGPRSMIMVQVSMVAPKGNVTPTLEAIQPPKGMTVNSSGIIYH